MLKSCFQNPGILLRSKLLFGRVLLVMYLLFKCLFKLPSPLFGNGGEQGKAEAAKRCWRPSSGTEGTTEPGPGVPEHPGGAENRRNNLKYKYRDEELNSQVNI